MRFSAPDLFGLSPLLSGLYLGRVRDFAAEGLWGLPTEEAVTRVPAPGLGRSCFRGSRRERPPSAAAAPDAPASGP